MDKDFLEAPADHHFHWKTLRTVSLGPEPLGPQDLTEVHDSSELVYYPDGGAKCGAGHAAFVRFRNETPEKASVWLLEDNESDSFTSE